MHTSTQSSDSVTITVTLPVEIAAGHEVNVTLTLRAQRTATARSNGDTAQNGARSAITPPRVPRFHIPEKLAFSTPNTAREAIDDPFINSSRTNGINGIQGNRSTGYYVDISDSESDDEDTSPVAIYPVREGQTAHTPGNTAAIANARYYVITKGKKIGVFFDTWCVHVLLHSDGSYLSCPPLGTELSR